MFEIKDYEILHEKSPKDGLKIYSARHVHSASRVNIYFLPVAEKSKALIDKIYQTYLPLQKLTSPHVARVYAINNNSDAAISGIAFIVEEVEGISKKTIRTVSDQSQRHYGNPENC